MTYRPTHGRMDKAGRRTVAREVKNLSMRGFLHISLQFHSYAILIGNAQSFLRENKRRENSNEYHLSIVDNRLSIINCPFN